MERKEGLYAFGNTLDNGNIDYYHKKGLSFEYDGTIWQYIIFVIQPQL